MNVAVLGAGGGGAGGRLRVGEPGTLQGVEVVFVVGPAYGTEPFGGDTRGHLHPGMTVVVCPSSCVGGLAFKHAAGLDLYDQSVVVGETSTLPYASRASRHASVRIFNRFDTGCWPLPCKASASTPGTTRYGLPRRRLLPGRLMNLPGKPICYGP